MVAWASPECPDRLPQAIFDEHEEGTARAAEEIGLAMRAPCRSATPRSLEARLTEGGGTPIVSLIAPGDSGGAVWLHADDHPAYPDDPGSPVPAENLAASFRKGKVRIALLWTSHGAGALARILLSPDHGDAAAVVASHAALRAERAAAMVERLLGALRAPAGGDFERAVSEARLALPDTDLQWAALVYHARPSGGRSVSLARSRRAGRVRRPPARWSTRPCRPRTSAGAMTRSRTGWQP
jgi:hypothetical protein